MLNINLGDYIQKKVEVSQKDMFEALKKEEFINYSYRNFSKKIKENSLTANELLAIAYQFDLDLNKIVNILKRYDKSKVNVLDNKDDSISSHDENIQRIITMLKKEKRIKANSFNTYRFNMKEKKSNMATAIWDTDNDEALLIYSNPSLTFGAVKLYLTDLDNFYGEMGIDWQEEKTLDLGNELIDDLESEYDSLKTLGFVEINILKFYFCEDEDDDRGKQLDKILPDKINGYEKLEHYKVKDGQVDFKAIRETTYLESDMSLNFQFVAIYAKELEDDDLDVKIVTLSNLEKNKQVNYDVFTLADMVHKEKDIKITKEHIINDEILFELSETIVSLNIDTESPETLVKKLKEVLYDEYMCVLCNYTFNEDEVLKKDGKNICPSCGHNDVVKSKDVIN